MDQAYISIEEIAEGAKAQAAADKYLKELYERWKKVLIFWRKRYGEVYLEATNGIRRQNLGSGEIAAARYKLLSKVRDRVLQEAVQDVRRLIADEPSFSGEQGGLTGSETRYILNPVSNGNLRRKLDLSHWKIVAEARKLRPPRRILGIRIEKKDPWLD